LGTIGGILHAEVLLGILTTHPHPHPHSLFNVDPSWTPQKERVIRIASQNGELFHAISHQLPAAMVASPGETAYIKASWAQGMI
jgi:hypothetical protein